MYYAKVIYRSATSMLVLGWALAAPPAAAQGDMVSARVDQLFAEWDRLGSPGCAVAVVHDGRIIYENGYGYANLDLDIPITPETVLYIGSTSKQFAAASVALAAQQGHLSLDDDIHKYLPEMPDHGRPITVRNLVHHTSGIRDYLMLLELAGRTADLHSNQDVIDLIARQEELNFEPGTEWSYTNSGYFLLSMIVQRATGKSLREYAEENIFRPLGMANTHFHDDEVRTLVIKNRAIAYAPHEEHGYTITYYTNFDKVGDGGLYTTVRDLARWDRNFYEPVVGGREWLEALQVPGRLANGEPLQTASGDTVSYAFALMPSTYRGLPVVGHAGGFMGYRAAFDRFPDQRFSVICLCNLATINPSRLVQRIADIYLEEHLAEPPAAPPTPPETAAEEPSYSAQRGQLVEYAGSYYSKELDTTYEILLENDKLLVRRHNSPDQVLELRAEDAFRVPGAFGGTAEGEFQRGPGGRLTGFVLNVGRAQGIKFERR